jgi:hypothetical protein
MGAGLGCECVTLDTGPTEDNLEDGITREDFEPRESCSCTEGRTWKD